MPSATLTWLILIGRREINDSLIELRKDVSALSLDVQLVLFAQGKPFALVNGSPDVLLLHIHGDAIIQIAQPVDILVLEDAQHLSISKQ